MRVADRKAKVTAMRLGGGPRFTRRYGGIGRPRWRRRRAHPCRVSLEEVHGTVAVPDHQAGFWPQMRAFAGPAILVSVGYMDPGNWGTDLQGGAQFKYGLLWVVALASLMAIFLQVIAARLGVVTGKDLAQCCRDWYPRLDALAELALVRGGHRRLRPGRSARQRRGAQPAVPYPAVLGGHHHRLRRAAPAGPAALRDADDRGGRRRAGGDHRRLLLHRDLRAARRPAPTSPRWAWRWFVPSLRQAGDARRGHRHHRGDGDAAQPVPALGPGAEPQAGKGRALGAPRHPLQHHRLDRGADDRVFRQCRHPGAGGDGVLRQGERDPARRAGRCLQPRQRLDPGRLPDAGAAAGHRGRQHAVCRRPVGQRAEQHHHRHAGRAGGDGRLHALADIALGCAG